MLSDQMDEIGALTYQANGRPLASVYRKTDFWVQLASKPGALRAGLVTPQHIHIKADVITNFRLGSSGTVDA